MNLNGRKLTLFVRFSTLHYSQALAFSSIEFATLGLFAGLLAAAAAELSVYILQTLVMDMRYTPTLWIWPLGIVSGALVVGSLGVFNCRKVVSVAPVTVLREL
jgi:putative ABC transport system permease protein